MALDEQQTHYAVLKWYVLLYPQGRGRARCYVVCNAALAAELRGDAARFIAQCSAALPDGALGPARAVGPLAFFPAADIWCERVAADSVVLLGDAAAANDPSRGQGLAICFRDARELRDALLADDDWPRAITNYAARRRVLRRVARRRAVVGAADRRRGPEADARTPRRTRPAGSIPSWAATGRPSSAPGLTGWSSTRPPTGASLARTCRLKTDDATRPLPASIADVTPDWLTAALAQSPAWDGARIVALPRGRWVGPRLW